MRSSLNGYQLGKEGYAGKRRGEVRPRLAVMMQIPITVLIFGVALFVIARAKCSYPPALSLGIVAIFAGLAQVGLGRDGLLFVSRDLDRFGKEVTILVSQETSIFLAFALGLLTLYGRFELIPCSFESTPFVSFVAIGFGALVSTFILTRFPS